MPRVLTYHISDAEAGQSVRSFLHARGYSHHILASLKPRPDAIRVNGAHRFMNQPLAVGEELTVALAPETPSEVIRPADVPFAIVYEDEDLMVIDKPAGVAIHPALNHPADTLANGIALYYEKTGRSAGIHCISRLDRDTTGLLVAAKHTLAASILAQDLVRRTLKRTYLALACGKTTEKGTVDLPIGRAPDSIVERCIDAENGQRAVTHFTRLSYNEEKDYSLLELHLDTGRTHQIRVHMAAIGHPLLGDSLYNPKLRGRLYNDQLRAAEMGGAVDDPDGKVFSKKAAAVDMRESGLMRQALHSWKLDFTHPVTGEAMHFIAPLPADMAAYADEPSGR